MRPNHAVIEYQQRGHERQLLVLFFKEHHFPHSRSLIVDIVMPGEEKLTILYVFHYLERIQL